MDNLFLIISIVSILAAFAFVGIAVVNFIGKNKEKGNKSLKKSVISLVVMVVSFIAFVVVSDSEEPKKVEVSGPAKEVVEKAPGLTAEEKAAAELKKKEEKKAKAKEKELAMSPEEKVEKIIIDKIGKQNNVKKDRIVKSSVSAIDGDPDGPINITLTLNASENFSNKMTRRSMWMDSAEILEPLSAIKGVQNITVEWLFPLVDQYGNASDGRIMMFEFPKEVFEKVNWKNFNVENLPNVSVGYFEHPALSK